MIGKDRAVEIVSYCLVNGDEATMKNFGIPNVETLARYKREAKKYLGKVSNVLGQIRNRYTDEELKKLAEGYIPVVSRKVASFDGEDFIILYLTDSHIGSSFTDMNYIRDAIAEGKKQGATILLHSGDVTEGMSGRDGHIYELSYIGYSAQRDAAVDIFKDWEGTSYFISGNHDLWYKSKADIGADVVEDICSRLSNAYYLGEHEGDVMLGGAKIRLWHGEDVGSYAISYRLQKLVESFSGGEKPNVLLTGHTHKFGYIFERNVHVYSGGCIQSQSPWMRRKRLSSHKGFSIIRISVKDGEVTKFAPTWYPFYK